MENKETVYRFRYTLDNRVKSVHASQEAVERDRDRSLFAWIVVAAGYVMAVVWWLVW